VGTVPDARGDIYVADLRVMVAASDAGFTPISMYARKARQPLAEEVSDSGAGFSWGMLGTNLSVAGPEHTFTTESERLVMMDRKDFSVLGLGLDDLIDAYVQTVLSVSAIDHMCETFVAPDGSLDWGAFCAVNNDPALLAEILI
jgi:hypothetical protein